jgi:hypothetical protein
LVTREASSSCAASATRDRFKLAPLRIPAGEFEAQSAFFQISEDFDFSFEFRDRLRGGRGIEDLLLDGR